tara:strand:- start:1525 stop:2418 length:894 start_codon:yes stop_codon:yes gene_type:complete
MIKKGNKGHQVARCQRMLNEKGYKTAVDADFGPSTEEKVKEFQKDNGLQADGIVGQKTWEPLLKLPNFCPNTPQKFIVHNGKPWPIKWDRVVLWDEPGGLKSNPGCYWDYSSKPERKPRLFVNHWDVCLSAEDCANVLNRRKVSVHFCIDGDGTIYQILDTQHGAWHASLNKANRESIGVEINNAYYLKYQKEYVKQGLGERPLQENGIVHGRTLKKFTWFYDAQIQALRALWGSIHEQHGIPLDYPKDENGDFCTTVHQGCRDASFEGFCNHYNMVDRKIDCAGLDLPNLLNFINF